MLTHTPSDARKFDCAEMELLLQADLDGELDAATAATVTIHIAHCEHCALMQQRLAQLRTMLSKNSLRETPSPQFNDALRQRLTEKMRGDASLAVFEAPQKTARPIKNIAVFAAGAALAASVLVTLMPLNRAALPTDSLRDAVIAEHVQSLQADHLLDVVSSDRHTVKPWFNGKLDFVPPVIDFADQGFALSGGRLAYLDNHNVAALVYRHGPHPINVFVWPGAASANNNNTTAPDCAQKSGYNICSWHKDALNYWVISDMSKDEMQKLVALLN